MDLRVPGYGERRILLPVSVELPDVPCQSTFDQLVEAESVVAHELDELLREDLHQVFREQDTTIANLIKVLGLQIDLATKQIIDPLRSVSPPDLFVLERSLCFFSLPVLSEALHSIIVHDQGIKERVVDVVVQEITSLHGQLTYPDEDFLPSHVAEVDCVVDRVDDILVGRCWSSPEDQEEEGFQVSNGDDTTLLIAIGDRNVGLEVCDLSDLVVLAEVHGQATEKSHRWHPVLLGLVWINLLRQQ